MRRDVEIELIKKAILSIEQHAPQMADAMSSNPVSAYTSAERLEAERQVLFRRFPIVVGFSSNIPEPGDFLTHELTGVPLLVTRSETGALNAFLNVCRHRGAHLVREACGKAKDQLTCPFHGWTYRLDGSLKTVPMPAAFPGLNRTARGLVPLAVAERFGLVFVLPTPGASMDIDAYLGPLLPDLGAFGLGGYMAVRPSTRTRKLNWKLYMDATHEAYHIGVLHSSSAGAGYFIHNGVFDWACPHARLVLPQSGILDLAGTNPDTWRLLDHAGILYSIFPNTCVLVHSGFAQVMTTFPVDTDSAVLHGTMLVPEGPVSTEESILRKFHYETYWKTMEEDLVVCESMQATMRSGANSEHLFGRHEYILGRYHEAIEAALSGALTP